MDSGICRLGLPFLTGMFFLLCPDRHCLTTRESTPVHIHAWDRGCGLACSPSVSPSFPREAKRRASIIFLVIIIPPS